jgi:hypothetical protein
MMYGYRLIGLLAAVAALSLAAASTATAGQLVYLHGGDLWTMSDSGGPARALATASQVGGTIGSGFGYYDGLAIPPNGTDIVFNAQVPDTASPGDCSGLCPGLYTLNGGKVSRLTAPAYKCGNGTTVLCESSETDPQVTTSGQVVYLAQSATLVGSCYAAICGPVAETSSELDYRAINGSGGATAWPLPASGQPNDAFPEPTGGTYNNVFASDPADPTKIAYAGDYETGLPTDEQCGPGATSLCYPITVEDSSGDYNEPGYDTGGYSGFSFSSDGSAVAAVQPGGIWVYPSAQSVGHSEPPSTTEDAVIHWALEDNGTNESTGGIIGNIAFVGDATTGKVVFSALNNLYTIPASCFAGAGPLTAGCGTFNAADPTSNANITQLTTDGTAAAPNTDPAWTSSTATIEPVSSPNNNNPPPPSGTTFKVSLSASSSQKVIKQKGLVASVKCNLGCVFAAGGGVEIKGSKKQFTTKQASGQLAANGSKTVTLKFSANELKTIKKALAKHKRVTAVILIEAKDAAGKKLSTSKQFGVKH